MSHLDVARHRPHLSIDFFEECLRGDFSPPGVDDDGAFRDGVVAISVIRESVVIGLFCCELVWLMSHNHFVVFKHGSSQNMLVPGLTYRAWLSRFHGIGLLQARRICGPVPLLESAHVVCGRQYPNARTLRSPPLVVANRLVAVRMRSIPKEKTPEPA